MSSRILITIDQEDGGGVEKYLGKLYGIKGTFLLDPFLNVLYILTFLFCRGYVYNLTC